MEKRLNLGALQPKGYKAMVGLEAYLQTSELSKSHINLIKTRASQINGCAYCLDMHTKESIQNGETLQRLFVLAAWKETDLFTEEEKAILGLTEEITVIHQHGVSDAVYKKAVELFGENYVAQIIMAVVAINGWNRIAVATHLQID
ncbi:carboxymuconolactone decarboxylase family protein [Cytophaga aurantiaca]|uniref:carboxymuconolactone decarboxylase family protein n=1 Tax=Cytophaga aurantiaca TaxID=29530 RepID=UPI000366F0F1|nr:carboxymuconolactone decarboxylase family protein [Cytophaga aurantiaca]